MSHRERRSKPGLSMVHDRGAGSAAEHVSDSREDVRLRRRMLLLAFVLFNLAIGLTYGSFGALVLALQARFATSLSVASIGISLVVLNNGLLASVVGWLIARVPLRRVMLTGAILAALGYAGLALAVSATQMVLCFAFLIGPGVCLLGPIPCYTLVSNWYATGQGKALGVVNMPLLAMALPILVTAVLPVLGMSSTLLLIGLGYALAIPLVLLVVDRPAPRAVSAAAEAAQARPSPSSVMPLLRMPVFWAMVVGAGLVVGAGIGKTAHLIPLLTEAGWSGMAAATLLSIAGGTGVIGSFLFGWIADRYSASATLVVNALLQALVWGVLIVPVSYPLLVVDAVLIGACGGGFIAVKGVLVSRLFGRERFPQVMGLSATITLPFLFGLSPLAGFLHDWTGSYAVAVEVYIGCFVIAAGCFATIMSRERRAVANGLQ